MALISQVYDHPTYTTRNYDSNTSVAGANAVGCKFATFTNQIAWSATAVVQTAGTSAGAGAAAIIQRVSGTSTTTLGTLTLGSSVANTVVSIPLSTTAGGVALLPGDVLRAVNGTDASSVYVLTYETSIAPGANVTQ
jgi:hypothetical protein